MGKDKVLVRVARKSVTASGIALPENVNSGDSACLGEVVFCGSNAYEVFDWGNKNKAVPPPKVVSEKWGALKLTLELFDSDKEDDCEYYVVDTEKIVIVYDDVLAQKE